MRYIDPTKLYKKSSTWGCPAELWTDDALKKDFRAYFFDKCWYTEVYMTGSDMSIDHFRPKKKVKALDGYYYNSALINGYDWLSNDIKNYRACCDYANRITGDGGKGCYFPLKDGSQCLTKGGSQIEEPMLLDPLVRDDVKLISFQKGYVICTSQEAHDKERVKVSKRLYNLDDPNIKEQRIKEWETIEREIDHINTLSETDPSFTHILGTITKLIDKSSLHSACKLACVLSLANENILAKLDLDL